MSKPTTSAEIDSLWNIGEPVAGYQVLEQALRAHPESSDEFHTQLARALGLQRRFDEAWSELAKVPARHSALVEVRVQLESGRIKNTSGDKPGAKPYFLKALELAQGRHYDYYAVDAAHMLAIVTSGTDSIAWNEKALSIARDSPDQRAKRWRASLLNNLGWTYHDAGEFRNALALFEEAVDVQNTYGDDAHKRIARWAVARCLRSLKRNQEALDILDDLIKFPGAGFVSEEMAEDLLILGKITESKPHFRRAYELLSKDSDLRRDEPNRLERLRELGG